MLNEQLKSQIEQEGKSKASDFGYDPGAEEYSDLQSSYEVGAIIYAEKWQEAQQRASLYEQALKDIISPIAYLQRKAAEEGAGLDGHYAQALANNVAFLQGIAEKAITHKTNTNE